VAYKINEDIEYWYRLLLFTEFILLLTQTYVCIITFTSGSNLCVSKNWCLSTALLVSITYNMLLFENHSLLKFISHHLLFGITYMIHFISLILIVFVCFASICTLSVQLHYHHPLLLNSSLKTYLVHRYFPPAAAGTHWTDICIFRHYAISSIFCCTMFSTVASNIADNWMNEWMILLPCDQKLVEIQFSPTQHQLKEDNGKTKTKHWGYGVREGSPVEVQWAVFWVGSTYGGKYLWNGWFSSLKWKREEGWIAINVISTDSTH